MAETLGTRFYAVRLACGDGIRTPLSLRAFADRVYHQTRHRLHASELSAIERDEKAPTLADVAAVAAVDPLRRGPAWLAGWAGMTTYPAASTSVLSAVAEVQRDTNIRGTDAHAASAKDAAKKPVKKRKPGSA